VTSIRWRQLRDGERSPPPNCGLQLTWCSTGARTTQLKLCTLTYEEGMNQITGPTEPVSSVPHRLEVGVRAVLVALVVVCLAFVITGVTFLPGADFRRSHVTALRAVVLIVGVALAPLLARLLSGRARPDGG